MIEQGRKIMQQLGYPRVLAPTPAPLRNVLHDIANEHINKRRDHDRVESGPGLSAKFKDVCGPARMSEPIITCDTGADWDDPVW